ncbi:nematode insulin-related peptide beta type domain-containing protein [Ditylenchus destructor]|uniref:Nematode insulin-related peptide beta type domain-containing protein n=1 Tax=Ditylenchus destructor TaxID=166010 RepID=A0AAD4MJ67_9BILA|nr:nematode insulin-related peptide beta type domain-containing protein [Ditylenchus destructor]
MKFFVYFVLLLSIVYFSTGEDCEKVKSCGKVLMDRVAKLCSSRDLPDFSKECCSGEGCCDSYITSQCRGK